MAKVIGAVLRGEGDSNAASLSDTMGTGASKAYSRSRWGPHPQGSPNGLETMSENLMLKFWFRNQVAPPLVEENDRPKIGASFG
jgi:hypothetical protein